MVINPPAVQALGVAIVNTMSGFSNDSLLFLDDGHHIEEAKIHVPYFLLHPSAKGRVTHGDIVEVSPRGIGRVIFSPYNHDNVLLITNACNSNCIMCPDAEIVRKNSITPSIDKLLRIISLLPDYAPHLCLTGGEPTLLKYDLMQILRACNEHLPRTSFLILSNGRSFSDVAYASAFYEVAPKKLTIDIPIYGDTASLHDSITRTKGSFEQALAGIQNLLHHKINVGIRIVIIRQNYEHLVEISQMIAQQLSGVYRVQFMGIELLGNAALNCSEVFVDFNEIVPYMELAAIELLRKGIESRFYNFPLCMIHPSFYTFYSTSISQYKIHYKPECEYCRTKSKCGGFFESTMKQSKAQVFPQ